MGGIGSWWDGVELWSTGLAFPVQAALVLAVLLPLAWAAAWGLDLLAAAVSSRRDGDDR